MHDVYTYEHAPAAPYQFAFFLERLRTSSNSYIYLFDETGFARAHRIGEHAVLTRVESISADPNAPRLRFTIHGAPDRATADEAARIWRHMLSVERDLGPFYAQMERDPVLRAVIEDLRGLHLLVDATPFESMVLAIIGQQVNLTFAENLKRALVELCGETITVDGHTLYTFPTPEAIARLHYDELRPLKFSQRKAEYIIDFARGVVNGDVDLDAVQRMSNDEAIATLSKLRGIGRWTVECVLLFGFGRADLLPAADIGLRNAMQLFYGLDEQPSEAQVREMARSWTGFESYVTYYLWTALGLAREAQKRQKQTRK